MVNLSATTFPQTLDWLHSYLLEVCAPRGICPCVLCMGRYHFAYSQYFSSDLFGNVAVELNMDFLVQCIEHGCSTPIPGAGP